MYLKAMVSFAIVGVMLSLIMCFFSLITWEIASVLIAVFLGIPALLSQLKTKQKNEKHNQEVESEIKVILCEETIRVSPTETFYYEFGLTRGENLKGTVSASSHIDIYFVNNANFKKWEKERDFDYEYCHESVFETKIDYVVPKKGTWYLLIENNGRKTAKVKVLLYI